MNKILRVLLLLGVLISLMIPTKAYATGGTGNVDGGGGGMGQGTSMNSWSSGNEGVRVSVVRVSDNTLVTSPIDVTNKPPSTSINNFGKVSKLSYNSGRSLTGINGGYIATKPKKAIPKIISSNGSNNIGAIKKYFCSEYFIKLIASETGINYDSIINGEYKFVLEPIAYYKFQGKMIVTTATEAALYNKKLGGGLRSKMVSLTHKNLPLAMFLEEADLGYRAWSGSRNSPASDDDIIAFLGIGIIRFTEDVVEKPDISIETIDYTYRINTDVISAVTVSGGQSDPDNATRVVFRIDGVNYYVDNIYYPRGGSQLVWVKWRTPSKKQTMDIGVSVYGPGSSSKGIIKAKIVDLSKKIPPNPEADDKNDSFSYGVIPSREIQSRADWSIWRPSWRTYWVDEGYWSGYSYSDGKGNTYYSSYWVSNWVDRGWWEFSLNNYYATFNSTMSIKPDSKNPTARGKVIKSGYGINQTVSANVSTNNSLAITYPQNAVSYFSEFSYKTYRRLLKQVQGGTMARFEFEANPYSTYRSPTHFTPIWMPDGPYTVNTWVIDSWTPVGMLSSNLSDSLTIRGSLWDDWHIAPLAK